MAHPHQVGVGFFLLSCFPVADEESLEAELFALVYAGRFNSEHVTRMVSAQRRRLLKRLHDQKALEDKRVKEARAAAEVKGKSKRRR